MQGAQLLTQVQSLHASVCWCKTSWVRAAVCCTRIAEQLTGEGAGSCQCNYDKSRVMCCRRQKLVAVTQLLTNRIIIHARPPLTDLAAATTND